MFWGILKKWSVFFLVLLLLFSVAGQLEPAQSQFESVRFEEIKAASLSSSRISGAALTPNTIILFKTNEGRYGKLLIKSSDYNLVLTWLTFNPDGTVHSRGENLNVRGTFTCDLDAGQESRSSVDFWWQIAGATDKYLTAQSGAAFAIYSPPSAASGRELTAEQKTVASTVDTSKRAESTKQMEKSDRVQAEERPSSIFKRREQPQPGQMAPVTGEPPASFQKVTYKFKSKVQTIRGEDSRRFLNNLKVAEEVTKRETVAITPGMKLVQGALIEPQMLPRLETGAIIYDETTKLAARITGKTLLKNKEYLVLDRPQIHEVLDEFEIPQQTVRLTSGNIAPLTPPAVQFQYRPARSSTMTVRSGERWHIKDPWLKISFDDVPLVAYTSGGRSISVRLSGRIGLTPIDVDGRYTGFSGYEFKLRSGEEISLKVTIAMSIKEDLKIPLFAIDIPALIATVRGGFYLLVGMDGSFTLVAEATQWLEAEAGVRGGTFLYIPTSFNPFFRLNKGFETEAFFAGQIKGYVKAGPLLELELLGFSLIGAGGLVGMGVDSKILGLGSESLLDVEIYGSLELYATLFSKRINFVNSSFNLYHLQKPNTAGYDIKYYEACAWRRSLWGNIRRDLGGRFEPVQARLEIEVKRNNKIFRTISAQPDGEGNFRVDVPFDLFKDDRIRIIKVGEQAINSAAVFPTLPFKQVRIEYADFFNDAARGQVSAAQVKNWNTGEQEYITYNRNIRFNNGALTTCDSEGNFALSHDFKPGQDVVASIEFNGFKVDSRPVRTDVAFAGKRFVETSVLTEYTDSAGRIVEKRVDREHFRVLNMRGEKQLTIPANYVANYYHYRALSRIYEYFSGNPIIPPVLMADKNYNFILSPVDRGASEIVQDFTEEWGWLGDGSGTSSSRQIAGVQETAVAMSQARPQIKVAKEAQLMTGSSPFFRYDSNKTRAQGSPADEGVQAIFRDGTLIINIEGAEIEVKDLSEKQAGQGHEPPRAGVNPGQLELLDRINSRINPVVLSSIDPISPRLVAPINKIRVKESLFR